MRFFGATALASTHKAACTCSPVRKDTLGSLTWMQVLVVYFGLFSWFNDVGGFTATASAALVSENDALVRVRNVTQHLHEKLHLRRRKGKAVFQVKETWNILNRFPLLNKKLRKEDKTIPTDRPQVAPDDAETGLWAVKLRFDHDADSRELLDMSAEMIAKRHGLENHGQIGELKGYYLFTKRGSSETWTTMASAVVSTSQGTSQVNEGTLEESLPDQNLLLNTQVEWQGHQELLSRSKRIHLQVSEKEIAKIPEIDPSQSDQLHADGSTPVQNTLENAPNTTVTKVTPALSTPSPPSKEEKFRHEFYVNFARQYSDSSTVTHQVPDATPNAKYRDMIGLNSGGGAGSRRMGVGIEEDEPFEDLVLKLKGPTTFQDPLYYRQWHLENLSGDKEIGDCNVTGVWAHGITGKGVVVAVVDDGVQWDHPDLIDNYCPEGSFDLNSNDDNPMPVRDDKEENKHGTRCAGEIAAAPNDHCGVGIAHGAKFSGIRILDGPLTDSMEAAAFNKHFDVNDIYSCSWGPEDDGKTVDGPHPLAQAALQHGIVKGRQGFGSVYIVASGNGGHKGDNCNYDGYANSIYTITIGAVDEFGRVPSYAEECASMLACTFSSGAGAEDGKARKIVTTDWTLGKNKKRISGCTESHTGTSAATPLAAGMVALMLEARPCLTWRDIQHIIVMTAVKIQPEGDEWTTNSAGYHHSDKKGFGLLNAWKLANAARVWQPVPWLSSIAIQCHDRRKIIPSTKSRALIVKAMVTKQDCQLKMLNALEQVSVTVDIDHPRRGDLFITLVCPSGTTSVIGRPRKNDDSAAGLWNWSFTTVKCWGEEPNGIYRLIIHDTNDRPRAQTGELRSWRLTLYGSVLNQENIDAQRKAVEAAMSGEHLQSWYKVEENTSRNASNTSEPDPYLKIGYCPPMKKRIYGSTSLLQMSTTEKVLKVLAFSGCFLIFWIFYYYLDMKRTQELKTRSQQKDCCKNTEKHKVTVSC